MRIQYILTQEEVHNALDRLSQLKHVALLSRDAGDTDGNREWYLKAKGFEEAMQIIGMINDTDRFSS